MNRRKLVVVAAVLVMFSPVLAHAATSDLNHIQSNENTGYDRLTGQDGVSQVGGGFELTQNTKSRGSFFGSKLQSANGNLDVTNDRIQVGKAYSHFEEVNSANEDFENKWANQGDGAYYNGNHYFLDPWATTTDDGWALRKWEEDGLTKVANYGCGTCDRADGAAHWKNDKIVVLQASASGPGKIWSVDTSQNSKTLVASPDQIFNNKGIAGAANAETASGTLWVLFEDGSLWRVWLQSDGSYNVEEKRQVSNLNDPNGLSYNEKTGKFYTFDQGDSKLKVIGSGGSILDTQPYSHSKWTVGAVDHGDGEDFNHGKLTMFNQKFDQNSVKEVITESLTYATPHTWTSKEFNLAPNHESLSNIEVSFNAPQLWGSYDVELQKQESDESTWSTIGSGQVSGSGSMTFSGGSFDVASSGVQFRLRLIPGQHHGISGNVRVTDFTFDYSYYPNSGSVLGHDQNDSSLGIDVGRATEIRNINVSGASPSGSSVDLEVTNKDGRTVYSGSSVLGSSLNVTDQINESKNANQRLFLNFDYNTNGLTTSNLTGFDIAYEPRPPSPEITDWSFTTEGVTTSNTSVSTTIDTNNTFTVEEVNQSVDYVDWYVDGQHVETQEVSGTGPFSITKLWTNNGEHTVRAETYSTDSGTDAVEWNVDVYNVLISGDDTVSSSTQFTLEPQFTVLGDPNAEIDFALNYNKSIVEKISGPDSGVLRSGGSKEWIFVVKNDVPAGYSGEPIEIVAKYDGKTTNKNISLSTLDDGGVIVGEGGGLDFSVLSNTWTDFLPLGGNPTPYFWIQGILAGGIVAAIWLQHLKLAWLPWPVSDLLNELQVWTKVVLSVDIFTLVLGMTIVPWWLSVLIASIVVWWAFIRGSSGSLTKAVSQI